MLNVISSIKGCLRHNTVENLNDKFGRWSLERQSPPCCLYMKMKEKEFEPMFLMLFDHIELPSSWYSMLPLHYEVRVYILIAQGEVHKRIICLNIILSIIFNAFQLISSFLLIPLKSLPRTHWQMVTTQTMNISSNVLWIIRGLHVFKNKATFYYT